MSAARDRTPCGIMYVYVKDGAEDAEDRLIHPYVVGYAHGSWYTVGGCAVSESAARRYGIPLDRFRSWGT